MIAQARSLQRFTKIFTKISREGSGVYNVHQMKENHLKKKKN